MRRISSRNSSASASLAEVMAGAASPYILLTSLALSRLEPRPRYRYARSHMRRCESTSRLLAKECILRKTSRRMPSITSSLSESSGSRVQLSGASSQRETAHCSWLTRHGRARSRGRAANHVGTCVCGSLQEARPGALPEQLTLERPRSGGQSHCAPSGAARPPGTRVASRTSESIASPLGFVPRRQRFPDRCRLEVPVPQRLRRLHPTHALGHVTQQRHQPLVAQVLRAPGLTASWVYLTVVERGALASSRRDSGLCRPAFPIAKCQFRRGILPNCRGSRPGVELLAAYVR